MTIRADESLTVPFTKSFSCCNLVFAEYSKPNKFNKDFKN